jgi:hypothetical protein
MTEVRKLYEAFAKGDVAGHEFHGNQYTGSGARAGNRNPGEGEVGSHEFKTYGIYHEPGDTVKDNHGTQHTVLDHRGAQVTTRAGEHFHPTKLWPVSGSNVQPGWRRPTKDDSARDLIKAALANPMPLPGPTFNPFTKAHEPPPNMFMTKKD